MKKVLYRCCFILGVIILNIQFINAQRVALKTNLIDWATLSPNMALEVRLNPKFSLDMSATANPFLFKVADIKATHFRFQPELRYWFNRPMARHFMGIGLLGGFYNMQFGSHIYEGDILAAGLTYGYVLVLSRHWNMEATVGVGAGKLRAFDYREGEDKPAAPNLHKWAPVPVRLGLSFSYIFK